MRHFLAIIALLAFVNCTCSAQVMILKNKKHHKTVIFKKGDMLCYKMGPDDVWKSGKIEGFDTAGITVSGTKVAVANIAALAVKRKGLNYAQDGGMLLLGGVALPTISLLNNLVNWEKPRFTQAQLIVTAALLTTGLSLSALETKKCIIGKRYALDVLIF